MVIPPLRRATSTSAGYERDGLIQRWLTPLWTERPGNPCHQVECRMATSPWRRRTDRSVRVDLHMHTSASFDCAVEPQAIARRCQALDLSPIFVTDHDTVCGAEALRACTDCPVIVGQEITTRDGDLIGLFLQQAIAPGSSALAAAQKIRSQGGLVYLPHPSDPSRRSLSMESVDRISEHLDIVEVLNGRSGHTIDQPAAELCRVLGAVAGAGSDAHSLDDLGRVCVEMEPFDGPRDFLAKLSEGRIISKPRRLLLYIEAHTPRLLRYPPRGRVGLQVRDDTGLNRAR